MAVERAVIPVDDLRAAIERLEAQGYRLVTISPADDPRIADLDGPDRQIRLARTATEGAVITVHQQALTIPELEPALVISRAADAEHGTGRAGMHYRDLIPGRLGGRFIASHMIFVRMIPDAPTNAPLITRPLFPSTKPVAQAASPE